MRDGEAHDYLTDLDAETLKRLGEVQGQLDGLGAQATALRQGMRELAGAAGQQRAGRAGERRGAAEAFIEVPGDHLVGFLEIDHHWKLIINGA